MNKAKLTLNFSLLGSFFTISSSVRQSAPGVSLGMHLRARQAGGQHADMSYVPVMIS